MLISDDGTRFALDKGEIAVLTSMMADPGDRPALAALWFHPAKAQAWATDGHRAVLAEHEAKPRAATTKDRPVAIPAITAVHVARTAGNRDLVVLDISGETVAIDVRAPKARGAKIETFDQIDAQTKSKHAVTCRRHSGEMGTIEHFFPTFKGRGSKGAAVSVDPALLQSVVMLAKVADPSYVWLNIGKLAEPVLVAAHGRHSTTWRVIVMPFRASAAPPVQVCPPEPAKPPRGAKAGRSAKKGPKVATPPESPDLRAVS